MSKLIISLSTIPPRFHELKPTIDCLLAQTADVAGIYIYVPYKYRRFPDWDGTLPSVPDGIEIRRCDQDWGPATKVLAAARDFRGQDVDILFCDDDRAYDPKWAQRFVKDREKFPRAAIANLGLQAYMLADSSEERDFQPRCKRTWRSTDIEFQLRYLWREIKLGRNWRDAHPPPRRVFKRSGYVDVFEGCAGCLVRPEFFDDVAYDIPIEQRPVDDVWLSGMMARLGIPIWLHANVPEPALTSAEPFAPLATSVVDGLDRVTANRLCVEYMQKNFGVWL